MDSIKTRKQLSEVSAKIDLNWEEMHERMLQSLQE